MTMVQVWSEADCAHRPSRHVVVRQLAVVAPCPPAAVRPASESSNTSSRSLNPPLRLSSGVSVFQGSVVHKGPLVSLAADSFILKAVVRGN